MANGAKLRRDLRWSSKHEAVTTNATRNVTTMIHRLSCLFLCTLVTESYGAIDGLTYILRVDSDDGNVFQLVAREDIRVVANRLTQSAPGYMRSKLPMAYSSVMLCNGMIMTFAGRISLLWFVQTVQPKGLWGVMMSN